MSRLAAPPRPRRVGADRGKRGCARGGCAPIRICELRVLASPVSLHDVRDVEGLCRNVLDRYLRTSGGHLRADHYEEALSHLFEVSVVLASRYDRSRSLTQLSFSTYSSRILEKRVTDWYRKKFGDDRYTKCRHCDASKVKWKTVACSSAEGH